MYIYADNAATTKTSQSAIDAMVKTMTDVYGNPSSLHSVGQKAKEVLEKARADVAKCIGADFKDIYFTSGGSEADNQAIISAAKFGALKKKKHIFSSMCISPILNRVHNFSHFLCYNKKNFLER